MSLNLAYAILTKEHSRSNNMDLDQGYILNIGLHILHIKVIELRRFNGYVVLDPFFNFSFESSLSGQAKTQKHYDFTSDKCYNYY